MKKKKNTQEHFFLFCFVLFLRKGYKPNYQSTNLDGELIWMEN